MSDDTERLNALLARAEENFRQWDPQTWTRMSLTGLDRHMLLGFEQHFETMTHVRTTTLPIQETRFLEERRAVRALEQRRFTLTDAETKVTRVLLEEGTLDERIAVARKLLEFRVYLVGAIQYDANKLRAAVTAAEEFLSAFEEGTHE